MTINGVPSRQKSTTGGVTGERSCDRIEISLPTSAPLCLAALICVDLPSVIEPFHIKHIVPGVRIAEDLQRLERSIRQRERIYGVAPWTRMLHAAHSFPKPLFFQFSSCPAYHIGSCIAIPIPEKRASGMLMAAFLAIASSVWYALHTEIHSGR